MGRRGPDLHENPAKSVVLGNFGWLVRLSTTRRVSSKSRWGPHVSRTRPPNVRMAMARFVGGLALGMLSVQAEAADIALKAPRPQPAFDWTGFYFGAHAGLG